MTRLPCDVERSGSRADLGRYEMSFTGVDREAEMTIAHAEFSRRMEGRGESDKRIG